MSFDHPFRTAETKDESPLQMVVSKSFPSTGLSVDRQRDERRPDREWCGSVRGLTTRPSLELFLR